MAFRQGALHQPFHGLTHGPRSEGRVEARGEQNVHRLVVDGEGNAAFSRQPAAALVEQEPGNAPQLRGLQRLEGQPVVEPVPQLRGQGLARRGQGAVGVRGAGRGAAKPDPRTHHAEGLGPEVGRQHHHRVGEVHGAAAPIREPSLLEHLEKHHEDVGVGLVHLVQEHHRARSAAHRLGELTAVLVTDVAGRRSDEPRGGVGLGELAHVQAHQRLAAPEEDVGQRAGHFRLADPGGPEEEEASHGTAAGEAGVVAADDLGHPVHHLGVPNHPGAELFLEAHEPRRVPHQEPFDGQPGNAGHHLRHVGGLHGAAPGPRAARAGQVRHRDGLVRKEAVRHVARREAGGGLHRGPGVAHAVVLLVAREQSGENVHRLAHSGLTHHYRGEAALQGSVAGEEAAELVVRRGANARELAPGQGCLEVIGRVLGALSGGTGAHQGVDFVDEEHHPPGRPAHLLFQSVEPLGEGAAQRRPGHQVRRRQLHEKRLAELAGGAHQPLGDALHHGGLAHPGVSHQAGVVRPTLAEHVEHLVDFTVSAHHRVQPPRARRGGEVSAQLGEERKGRRVEARRVLHRSRDDPQQGRRRGPEGRASASRSGSASTSARGESNGAAAGAATATAVAGRTAAVRDGCGGGAGAAGARCKSLRGMRPLRK